MVDNRQKEIVFEANSKSKGIAYLLWVLAGWAGAHRFYAGETRTGAIQLVLAISVIGWIILPFWLLADLFLIPGMINERNLELIRALNSDGPRGYTSELRDDRFEERGERREEPVHEPTPKLEGKRARMLEDLRATGYRKPARDFSKLYR